jgi:hypothetical protein
MRARQKAPVERRARMDERGVLLQYVDASPSERNAANGAFSRARLAGLSKRSVTRQAKNRRAQAYSWCTSRETIRAQRS